MKRVLVVDDDRRTRRVLQILIERIGLESHALDNAEEALEYLERESVALIFTDLKMPRMSGIEFMRKLRMVDEHVPVIVMTAYGTVDVAGLRSRYPNLTTLEDYLLAAGWNDR